jgi:hypothetical protein
MATQDWKNKSWRDFSDRKSDFLGTWDIPELFQGVGTKIVTIKSFDSVNEINKQNKKAIILYVEEYKKGIVLNESNKKELTKLYSSAYIADWYAGAKIMLFARENIGRVGEKIGIGIRLLNSKELIFKARVDFNNAKTLEKKRELGFKILEFYQKGSQEYIEITESIRTEIELFKEQNPNE